jgi:hypothetical protein
MRKTRTNKGKTIEMSFDSVSEILDYISDTPESNYSRGYNKPSFCPFTWEESIRLFREGWPDGVKDITFQADRINDQIDEASGYGIEQDVTGDYIDVGSYLEGVPECFGKMVTAEGPKDEVEIIVSATVSARVDKSTVFNRGAAIASLIDQLRRTHFVKLSFVVKVTGIMGSDITTYFHVNMQNEYSRDLIAFMAANAAYLRRIWFSVAEKVLERDECGGYGHVSDITPPPGVIYFEGLTTNEGWETIDEATQRVQAILDGITQGNA